MRKRIAMEPMGRLVSHGVAAVEPGMFGIGPAPAVRLAPARANWKMSDLQHVEINRNSPTAAVVDALTRERLGER